MANDQDLDNSDVGKDRPKAVLTRKKTTCVLKERSGVTPVLRTKYEASLSILPITKKRWSRKGRGTLWRVGRPALTHAGRVSLRPNAKASVGPLVLKQTKVAPIKVVRLKAANGSPGRSVAAHDAHFENVAPAKKLRMTPVRDRLNLTSKRSLKRGSAIALPKRAALVVRNSRSELTSSSEKRVFTSAAPVRLDPRSQSGSEAVAQAQPLSSAACPPPTTTLRPRFATTYSTQPAKPSRVAVTTSLQKRAAIVRRLSAPPRIILPSDRVRRRTRILTAPRDDCNAVGGQEMVTEGACESEAQTPHPDDASEAERSQRVSANSHGRLGATSKSGRAMPLIDMLVGHLSGGWTSTDVAVSQAASGTRVTPRPAASSTARTSTNTEAGKSALIRAPKGVATLRISEQSKKHVTTRATEEGYVSSSAREQSIERAVCHQNAVDARQEPGMGMDAAMRQGAGVRVNDGRMERSASGGGQRQFKSARMGRSASDRGKRVIDRRVGRSASAGERRVISSRVGRAASVDREIDMKETQRRVRNFGRAEEKKRVERAVEEAKAPMGARVTRYGGASKNSKVGQCDDDDRRVAKDVWRSETEVSARGNKESQMHPRNARKMDVLHPQRNSVVERESSQGEDHRSRSARKGRIAPRVLRTYNHKDVAKNESKKRACSSSSKEKSDSCKKVLLRNNENKRTGEHARGVNDDVRRQRRASVGDEERHPGRPIQGKALAQDKQRKYTSRPYDTEHADARRSKQPRTVVPSYKSKETAVSDCGARGRTRRMDDEDTENGGRNRKRLTGSEDAILERKGEKRRNTLARSDEGELDRTRKRMRSNERTGATENPRQRKRTFSLVSGGSSEPKEKMVEMEYKSHGIRPKSRGHRRSIVSSDGDRASRKSDHRCRRVDHGSRSLCRQKDRSYAKKTVASDSESKADVDERRNVAEKKTRSRRSTENDEKRIKHTRQDHAVSDAARKRRAQGRREDQSPPQDSKKRKDRLDTSPPVQKSRGTSLQRVHGKNVVTVKHGSRDARNESPQRVHGKNVVTLKHSSQKPRNESPQKAHGKNVVTVKHSGQKVRNESPQKAGGKNVVTAKHSARKSRHESPQKAHGKNAAAVKHSAQRKGSVQDVSQGRSSSPARQRARASSTHARTGGKNEAAKSSEPLRLDSTKMRDKLARDKNKTNHRAQHVASTPKPKPAIVIRTTEHRKRIPALRSFKYNSKRSSAPSSAVPAASPRASKKVTSRVRSVSHARSPSALSVISASASAYKKKRRRT